MISLSVIDMTLTITAQADHLIGHFYKMKYSVKYAEEKPIIRSTRRKRKLRQMLTKASEFRLGGGMH
jgi:uncharacterized protein YneF (UPF0154 family)